MKNQYFGDLNDYQKYSLLRHLSGEGTLRGVVCWLLTEDDENNNGTKVKYLQQEKVWKKYDPQVFEHIRNSVLSARIRSVEMIENGGILPNFNFYKERFSEKILDRELFFRDFKNLYSSYDLIFFDPDNGIGIKSVKKGTRGSSRYIYLDEIAKNVNTGASILIYQHFPRKNRRDFITKLIREIMSLGVNINIFAYVTSYVVYLLLAQSRHEKTFERGNRNILQSWEGKVKIMKMESDRSAHLLPHDPFQTTI